MGTVRINGQDLECPLAYGDNTERRCAWCGEHLTGRRLRWCSDEHAYAWSNNHWFGYARNLALVRDHYTCQRCGIHVDACDEQGMPLEVRLEVNHKVPCLGAHDRASCKHHVAELETLCRVCHLAVTREQFGRVPLETLPLLE